MMNFEEAVRKIHEAYMYPKVKVRRDRGHSVFVVNVDKVNGIWWDTDRDKPLHSEVAEVVEKYGDPDGDTIGIDIDWEVEIESKTNDYPGSYTPEYHVNKVVINGKKISDDDVDAIVGHYDEEIQDMLMELDV